MTFGSHRKVKIASNNHRNPGTAWRGLVQLLHRSREALLNRCIIHHHEYERNPGQTRYTRTGIFRQWAALFLHVICKFMGIRPLDIQSPISTAEWVGRKGCADCEENHKEGTGIGSRSLHQSTIRRLFRTAESHLHSC